MRARVFLADDHLVVRQGFKALLEKEGFEVVGEALDGREAVRLIGKLGPDVAVLDLAMPLMNGLDAARGIRRVSPRTKIILLTMYGEDRYVLEAFRAGVAAYVLKSTAAGDLIRAIREVSRGRMYLSPELCEVPVKAYLANAELPADLLTLREREVLQLVAEGKTTKEIAGILEVSVKTAESHRIRVMTKLDVHNTASLVRYAMQRGLIFG